MKVYIIGPMSGLPAHNRDAFFAAAKKLNDLGMTVLNPAVLPDGLTERDYMSICLPMLMAADSVHVLAGSDFSKGAKTEQTLAVKLGMDITHEAVPHDPSEEDLKGPQRLEGHSLVVDMGPQGVIAIGEPVRTQMVVYHGSASIEVMNNELWREDVDGPILKELINFVAEWEVANPASRRKMKAEHEDRVLFHAFMTYMRHRGVALVNVQLSMEGNLSVRVGMIDYFIRGLR